MCMSRKCIVCICPRKNVYLQILMCRRNVYLQVRPFVLEVVSLLVCQLNMVKPHCSWLKIPVCSLYVCWLIDCLIYFEWLPSLTGKNTVPLLKSFKSGSSPSRLTHQFSSGEIPEFSWGILRKSRKMLQLDMDVLFFVMSCHYPGAFFDTPKKIS